MWRLNFQTLKKTDCTLNCFNMCKKNAKCGIINLMWKFLFTLEREKRNMRHAHETFSEGVDVGHIKAEDNRWTAVAFERRFLSVMKIHFHWLIWSDTNKLSWKIIEWVKLLLKKQNEGLCTSADWFLQRQLGKKCIIIEAGKRGRSSSLTN